MTFSAVFRWNVMTDKPTTSGWNDVTRWVTVCGTDFCARIRSATATLWCGSALPASEASAPFGIRIVSDGVCSNESGIEKSRTFMSRLDRDAGGTHSENTTRGREFFPQIQLTRGQRWTTTVVTSVPTDVRSVEETPVPLR